MAILLKADGTQAVVAPNDGPTFTLEEMQEHVGGYIELFHLANGNTLVLNEDGTRKRLDVNLNASTMAYDAGQAVWGGIVGDVLVCSTGEIQ